MMSVRGAVRVMRKPLRSNGAVSVTGWDDQPFPKCVMHVAPNMFSLRLPTSTRIGPEVVASEEVQGATALEGNHSKRNCISKSPSSMAPRAAVFHVLAMC